MPDGARGPRAIPLPPNTERDTRLLFAFRPAALPWLLGALLWGTAAFVLPMAAAAKVPLGLLLPGGALAALAADAPERVARTPVHLRSRPSCPVPAGKSGKSHVTSLFVSIPTQAKPACNDFFLSFNPHSGLARVQ
jgi:hypothetical protein